VTNYLQKNFDATDENGEKEYAPSTLRTWKSMIDKHFLLILNIVNK